jgi:hypothetical protein
VPYWKRFLACAIPGLAGWALLAAIFGMPGTGTPDDRDDCPVRLRQIMERLASYSHPDEPVTANSDEIDAICQNHAEDGQ